MRQRTRLCAAIVAACGASHVLAQQSSNPDQRLDQFERRLNEMDQRHRAELKARDEKIANLERQLRERTVTPTPTADDIERAKTDVLRDLESRNPVTQEAKRTPVSFNPDLAVVGDFRGNVSTNNDNPARNRFDIGSVELDLRAAVDPRADGVVILPVARDVEDPLFFRKGDPVDGAVDTGIEIEEAYLFLHDFGVPNLTAKLGRFHLRFGRQNLLHSHDWPTVDNNFVNQSFLGPESLSDSGLSLSYVIPTKYTFGQYVEAIAEIITGEGSEESPVVNNDALVDGPALNLHVLWNTDVGRDWNLELGGSWLTARHDDDNRQDVNLFGADVTLIHTDPSGRFNNQLFQAEAIYGDVDTSRTATQHAFGAYVLAQQQVNRDWYFGTRLDWTRNALDEKQEVWAVSPYASWYWSEFLRFRLEYQHKGGDVEDEDTLYFQVTFIYGAHPPHPYWALR